MTQKRRVIVPAILGNVVEYYDFGMYAIFAPIIGSTFFPGNTESDRILLAFLVFAIGFFMRPLGGLIFGHIGDRFGRKISLNISIVGMALSTFTIGVLPGYSQFGITATIILIIVRMVQGICIGGEGSGSAIFIIEHFSKKSLGIIGSVVMASNVFGNLLSVIVAIFITKTWGVDEFTWRYGFILGAIMGIYGSYARSKSAETPIFHEIKQKKKLLRTPIRDVIGNKRKALGLIVALAAAATSASYIIRAYMNTFFLKIMGYPADQSLYFCCFCLTGLILFLPLFGFLAEKVGQRTFLKFAAVGIMLVAIPVFKMISNPAMDARLVYCGLFIMSITTAAILAPAYPCAIKMFPPELRFSGVALGWNTGNAIFGGTTPFIATLLAERFSVIGPAYYLIFTSAIFIVVNRFLYQNSYEMLRQHISNKTEFPNDHDTSVGSNAQNNKLKERIKQRKLNAKKNDQQLVDALRNNLLRRKTSQNTKNCVEDIDNLK